MSNILRMFLPAALLLSSLAFVGCASKQSDSSLSGQEKANSYSTSGSSSTSATKSADADKANDGFDWNRLNPLAWDYGKFGNEMREKYQFKVGDTWLIKPPVEPNPVRIEIHRRLGSPVDWQDPTEMYMSSEPAEVAVDEVTSEEDESAVAEAGEAESMEMVGESASEESSLATLADQMTGEAESEESADVATPAVDDDMQITQSHQTLAIDLVSGKASFTDVDGVVYPLQIRSETLQRIRTLARERSWIIRRIKPAKEAVDPAHFLIVAYEVDHAEKHTAKFAKPAAKELPELHYVLMDELDQAHRLAHPLSETVNLLK